MKCTCCLVMCRLRPEARSQAKPSQKKLGQAGPDLWPETAFGPAWILGKPKPLAWAGALSTKIDCCKSKYFLTLLLSFMSDYTNKMIIY